MPEHDTPPHQGAPWVTLELEGLVLHVPLSDGSIFALPLTPDGAYALLGELAERLQQLKTDTAFQKKVAGFIAEKAIGWLAKRWVSS